VGVGRKGFFMRWVGWAAVLWAGAAPTRPPPGCAKLADWKPASTKHGHSAALVGQTECGGNMLIYWLNVSHME
jgi:hypothetical protein